MDGQWYRYGRAYAWLHGACFVLASALFLLLEFNLTTPVPPDSAGDPTSATQLAAQWAAISAFQRAIWWQVFARDVLYVVGMLALLPIGLTLRALYGRGDARPDLMAASFGVGGVLGAVQTVIDLGLVGHTAAVGATLPADAEAAFLSLSVVNGIVGSINYWLLLLFFLLIGLALYRLSRLVHERGLLPPRLGQVALVVAILYWLALLAPLGGGVASVPGAALVYQFVILVGGVGLAPLWAFWLGLALDRAGSAVRVPQA